MAVENEPEKPIRRRMELRPGQPMQVSTLVNVGDEKEPSALCVAMALSLKAYQRAARELVEGQFAGVREFAPPHLRVPCHVYVFGCPDGFVVRYDATDEEPKVRYAEQDEPIAEMAPKYSEFVFHVPDDPSTYVPKHEGPAFIQTLRNERGEETEHARIYPVIYAQKAFPANYTPPPPPARPPCLASLHRELEVRLEGEVRPANVPPGAISTGADRFIGHAIMSLPVGWQAIEVYPRLGEEYWRPEYAASWAQLDLWSVIAQRNASQYALQQLDGQRTARERYARILQDFEALLAGPEEPCHQFLKSHPELLCPTHEAAWSKVPFGKHVSDFVFREPRDDYLLVEIEAPHRELFRKDGYPRQELTHAVGQIDDWLAFIQDHKAEVEHELGLRGISATPRTLIVIGRLAALSEENRRKLAVMQGQRPHLSVITYDELIERARANLERLLGPLSIRTQNLTLYFYRGASRPEPA